MWTKHPTLECEVNELGQIRTYDNWHKTWVIRKTYPNKKRKGYLGLQINGKYKMAHRVIAETLIPNPENKPTVNHKDGDKTNLAVSNLEWNTYRENNMHAIRTGLHTNFNQKAVLQLDMLGNTVQEFVSISKAAELTGFDRRSIQRNIQGKVKQTHNYKFIIKGGDANERL